MKVDRHSKIVELIGKYQIETQEELAARLKEAGYLFPCFPFMRYTSCAFPFLF